MEYEKIKRKLIWSIEDEDIKKNDTASIFPKELLGKDDSRVFFRRGDTPLLTGNSIPAWIYPLLFDKLIIFIKACRDEKEFINYAGLKLKDLADLVNDGFVIPLIGNDLGGYNEDIYGKFFKRVKDDSVVRAQLYEDYMVGKEESLEGEKANRAFENKINSRAEKYLGVLSKHSGTDEERLYKNFQKFNPLIPDFERLPGFIAERVEWQNLFGRKKNAERIESSLNQSPYYAYHYTRLCHYLVNHKLYARCTNEKTKSIIALACGEEQDLANTWDYFGSALPLSAPFAKSDGFLFKYPRKHGEIKSSLKLLKKCLLKKEYLQDAVEGIHLTMKDLWNTDKFHKNQIETSNEYSAKLNVGLENFSGELTKYLTRIERAKALILRPITGTISDNAVSWSFKYISGISTSALAPFSLIYMLGKRIHDFATAPKRVRNDLEKMRGELQLYRGEEHIKTPFIVIDYPNPYK